MEKRIIDVSAAGAFQRFLQEQERSAATVEKYLSDVRRFAMFAEKREVTKELVMEYKHYLIQAGYAVRSVNSMLASVNSLLCYLGWSDCRVKSLKTQREVYCPESRELTKTEYLRLLEASKDRPRLNLLLQTISGTGIRISELRFFTVEAVKRGEVRVNAKGKSRMILLPSKLKKSLLSYAKRAGIVCGLIFRTRSGRPLNRSNVWAEMKKLCAKARVEAGKVFPHNLRKLFARTFYAIEKDIAKLADLLGHSSIDTTRIYIVTSGQEHRRKLEQMHLVI